MLLGLVFNHPIKSHQFDLWTLSTTCTIYIAVHFRLSGGMPVCSIMQRSVISGGTFQTEFQDSEKSSLTSLAMFGQ